MEFRFNLNEIFRHPMVEVGNTLIPPGFSGDRRALWDAQSKIAQIVNAMGEASARAQGLTKPITTADRLRNSEHKLYLLIDQSANNGKGAVTGMLKTGEKGLYVFDREGQHYKVSPPCVLDFYVHESRQRSGFGKRLFEHMLQREQTDPVKMAIDRPSDKFLGFLNKYYGLNNPVKQMNNFVVYDGFFPRSHEPARTAVESDQSYSPNKKQSANGLQQGFPTSPYGRYAARRPPCSMGQIIHNDSPVIKRNQEPSGVRSEPFTNIHGQPNYYYSNQQPAWQSTQSVPNMQYAYAQNPPNYASSQNPCVQNQQYPQTSQLIQNGYLASGGDYQNIPKPADINPSQMQVQNYTLGQGDVTGHNQSVTPTNPAQRQVHYQAPYQNQPLPNTYQNAVNTPGQTCYYDPQTKQYYMLQTLSQQNIYPTQQYADAPKYYQPTQAPVKVKEPLIPQSFDGAPRKTPHVAQSMPVQYQHDKSPVALQNSISAPINYYQQQEIGHHENMRQEPASQMVNVNDTLTQQTLQYQTNVSQMPNVQNVTTQRAGTVAVDQQAQGMPRMDNVTAVQQFSTADSNEPAQTNADVPKDQTNLQPNSQKTPCSPSRTQITHAQEANPTYQAQPNEVVSQMVISTGHQYQQNVQQVASTHQVTACNIPAVAGHMGAQYQQSIQQVAPIPQMDASNAPTIAGQVGAQYQQSIQQVAPTPQMATSNATTIAGQVGAQYQQNSQQASQIQQEAACNAPAITGHMGAQYQQNSQQAAQIQQEAACNSSMQQQHQPNLQPVASMPQVAPVCQQPLSMENPEVITKQAHQIQPSGYRNLASGDMQSTQQYIPRGNQYQVVQRQQPCMPSQYAEGAMEPYSRQMKGEVDISNGYPPHNIEKLSSAQNNSTKADRPNSLNIDVAEERGDQTTNDEADNAKRHEEALDGHNEHEDVDSLDGIDEVDAIEGEIEKVEIAPKSSTPLSKGSKSPGAEQAAGIVTPGRSTPGLTEQGYFDLKFYHNKLW